MKTVKCYITEDGIISIMENVPINETKEWFKNKAFELSGAKYNIDLPDNVEYDESHLTIFGKGIEGAIFPDDNVYLSSGNNIYSLRKSNYKDEVLLDINGTTYIRLLPYGDGDKIEEIVYFTDNLEEEATFSGKIKIR